MNEQNTDVKSLAHKKWNCKYHVVFAPKYQRKVFFNEKREDIRDIIKMLCQWKGVDIIEIECQKDFDDQKAIARLIDYSYFIELAGIPKTKNISEKVQNLCKYFRIADLRILKEPDFLVNFRTGISNVEEKNIINSRAWIQTAMNLARGIETKPFDRKKLVSYLPELRSMTLQRPEVFYPRMKEIFSECGVVFILLPHLKNSGVNGAVKWVNSDRVIMVMNNRGLYADKFWFSLFHEIKHVLQQKVKTTFISGDSKEMQNFNDALEKEADDFATNYLIPQDAFMKFSPNKFTSDEDICMFAKSIGIHLGIVAGRLQHEKIIGQNRCSKLKEQYVIEISA